MMSLSTWVLAYTRGRQPTARGPDAASQSILLGPRPFIVLRQTTFFLFSMIDMQQ